MKSSPGLSAVKFARRALGWGARQCERLASQHGEVVTLVPAGAPKGHVVFSYHRDPWVYPATRAAHYHTNRWECGLMGDTFVEAGFRVDVVEHTNAHYVPRSDCAFAFDLEQNLEGFARHVSPGCVKIQHASTPHWLFYNRAELERLYRIQQRRGVALKSRRGTPANLASEVADQIIYVGNNFTADTYRFAQKPMQRIPISTVVEYPWPAQRDWEKARRHYVWLGSVGLALKGLDLALEAFAQMPDLHLHIAGGIELDPDFKAAYHRELYETPNIHTIGWIDILNPEFTDLLSRCAGVIYPSASEGGAGSVIACMHGGLIPIVTREASVDVFDFGLEHRDDEIATIVADVRRVAAMPAAELDARARAAWEHARRVHTRDHFRKTWRDYARTTLGLTLSEP